MLSPDLDFSVLLFSFHAVTWVRNHVFITQRYIRLWGHSSSKEMPLEEGCSRQVLCQGKCFWRKALDNPPQQPLLSIWPSQRYAYTDGWRQMYTCTAQALRWSASSQLGSAWLQVPELRAFTKGLSWAHNHRQGQLIPYHCLSMLTSLGWNQSLKSQEVMQLSHRTPHYQIRNTPNKTRASQSLSLLGLATWLRSQIDCSTV